MTYENKWEWKANYKYKWDNFLDYDMKNHDIHENKNVCPEFNGEKMHEHQKQLTYSKKEAFCPRTKGFFWFLYLFTNYFFVKVMVADSASIETMVKV